MNRKQLSAKLALAAQQRHITGYAIQKATGLRYNQREGILLATTSYTVDSLVAMAEALGYSVELVRKTQPETQCPVTAAEFPAHPVKHWANIAPDAKFANYLLSNYAGQNITGNEYEHIAAAYYNAKDKYHQLNS